MALSDEQGLIMLKKVRKTITDSALLERGDHLLVAVSGGPDSVALLWMLVLLPSNMNCS